MLTGVNVNYEKSIVVHGDTASDIAIPASGIAGLVTEAGTSQPVPGAVVTVQHLGSATSAKIRTTQADATGRHSFDDLDPGNYQVQARKSGYRQTENSISLQEGTGELNLALHREDGQQIHALDALTETPLGQVSLLIMVSSGAVAFPDAVTLYSTGQRQIPPLPAGRYSVTFFAGDTPLEPS